MKKSFIVLSGLLLLASLVLVSWAPRSARDVATEWLNDFYHGDYAAAAKHSTQESGSVLELFEQNIKVHNREHTAPVVIDVRETGEAAVVTFVISFSRMDTLELKMTRNDREWQVEYSQADFNRNTPEDVAFLWLSEFAHAKFQAAEKYSTNDTKKVLEAVQELVRMVPDSNVRAMQKIKIEIDSVVTNRDTAFVKYTSSDQPGIFQPLKLIKADGWWLVLFTKEDTGLDDPQQK